MNNYISELIDEIAIVESESTISVIESMMDIYDKADLIEEYVSSDTEYDGYFQEGAIDNVKMKGMTDSNKFVTAIKFIPRLIKELIKQLVTKLKRHPEGLSKKEVENVHAKVEKCLVDAKYRDKLNTALKAIGITVGLVGANSLVFRGVNRYKESRANTSTIYSGKNPQTRIEEILIVKKNEKTGEVYLRTLDLRKISKVISDFKDSKTRDVNEWNKLSKKLGDIIEKGTVEHNFKLFTMKADGTKEITNSTSIFQWVKYITADINMLMADFSDEQKASTGVQGDKTFKTFDDVRKYINDNRQYIHLGSKFTKADSLYVKLNDDNSITITTPTGESVSAKTFHFTMNTGGVGVHYQLVKKKFGIGKENQWRLETVKQTNDGPNMRLSDKRSKDIEEINKCYDRILEVLGDVKSLLDIINKLIQDDEEALGLSKPGKPTDTPKGADKEDKGDEE